MTREPEHITRDRLRSYRENPDEVIPKPVVKRRPVPLERAPAPQCPCCGQVIRR